MDSPNKKPGTSGTLRPPFKPHQGQKGEIKPLVAQLKAVSAQSSKQPVAPAAYRPQTMPKAVQPKRSHNRLVTPSPRAIAAPRAPSIYRPQPVQVVLQTRVTSTSQTNNSDSTLQSRPPARFLPESRRVLESQVATTHSKAPLAPALFRPRTTSTALQGKLPERHDPVAARSSARSQSLSPAWNRTIHSIIQAKGHKPKVGTKVRYEAEGPGQGDEYEVIASDDQGGLSIKRNNQTTHVNWKNDKIWMVRTADAKDKDRRINEATWAGKSKNEKKQVYEAAKQDAVDLIKTYVKPGMINQTNKTALQNNLKWTHFEKKKKGEWVCVWEEPTEGGGRKWQFTIDMDKPLDTSDQEPHVGWEVKLLSPGKKGNGDDHLGWDKGQGHVWLNEVPEWRAA